MSIRNLKIKFVDDTDGMIAQDCYTGLTNIDESPFIDCQYSEEDDIITISGEDTNVELVLSEIEDAFAEHAVEIIDDTNESIFKKPSQILESFRILKEARKQIFTNKLRPAHKVAKTFGSDFALKARIIKSVLTDNFVSAVMEVANYKIERQDIKARVLKVVEEADLKQYDEQELIDYVTDEVIAWAEEQGRD